MHARLTAAPRGATGEHGAAQAHITQALLAALGALDRTDQGPVGSDRPNNSPRTPTRTSSPACPEPESVRAARLLAEIGDCRGRFPTPEALACLAGVAPSTRQSGKIRSVGFRWSCDKQLRDAVTDFAGDSRRANPWAADLYDRAIARGHDHPHAVRILARAWIYVIWHCWQNNTAYAPTATEPSNVSSKAATAPRLDVMNWRGLRSS